MDRSSNHSLRQSAAILALLALLLAATFAAFSPGLGGDFLLDDAANIPATAVSSLDWEQIQARVLRGTFVGSLSRSLTYLSFALTQYFSGYDPQVFKYQNLLIHLINGLLVYWLLSLLLGVRGKLEHRQAQGLALVVTAIWLLHPLQVSTVLYAVQRLVLLSALFVLLALIVYVKGRLLMASRPYQGLALALAGLALFGTLGLISKENAALIPFYVAAIEFFFFPSPGIEGPSPSPSQWVRAVWLLRLLVVALPVALGLAFLALRLPDLLIAYEGRQFSLVERLLTQVHVLALYLKLILVPLPGAMSLFHDDFPVRHALDLATLALALGYVGAILIAIGLRSRAPVIGFGILWFFACHLMESSFVPLELVFEHRNYLALLGPTLVLVGLWGLLARTALLRRVSVPLALGLVLLLGLNTAARAFVWGNAELMYRTEYLVRPKSGRVLTGLVYYEATRGNAEEANRYLAELQALGKEDAAPYVTQLILSCRSPQAIPEIYAQALALLHGGIVSAFTVNIMDSLVLAHVNGDCPALGFAQLHALTLASTQNKRNNGPSTRCYTRATHVRLLVNADLWQEATGAFEDMLSACSTLSAADHRNIIDHFIHVGATRGRMAEITALLNSASARFGDLMMSAYGVSKTKTAPDDREP